jgi:hypothetical protein
MLDILFRLSVVVSLPVAFLTLAFFAGITLSLSYVGLCHL